MNIENKMKQIYIPRKNTQNLEQNFVQHFTDKKVPNPSKTDILSMPDKNRQYKNRRENIKFMNGTKIRKLTSLEYFGMESLFQKIIGAYEDYLGIPEKAWIFSKEISRWTETGIEVFDGPFNFYCIQKFAVKNFFIMEDVCIMAGFDTTN